MRKVFIMAETITAKSVQFDPDSGTPFLMIDGEKYDAMAATLKAVNPEVSSADRETFSKAAQVLMGAVHKEVKAEAKSETAESARLELEEKLVEVIGPVTELMERTLDFSHLAGLQKDGEKPEFRFSLSAGNVTIQIPAIDKGASELVSWAEKIGSKSINFAYNADDKTFKPIAKIKGASGTRSTGSATMESGVWQMAEGKEADGTDGSFAVLDKKLYYLDDDGNWVYLSGQHFLQQRTADLGSDEQYAMVPTEGETFRPWGHPSKKLGENSERTADLSDADQEAIKAVKTHNNGN